MTICAFSGSNKGDTVVSALALYLGKALENPSEYFVQFSKKANVLHVMDKKSAILPFVGWVRIGLAAMLK